MNADFSKNTFDLQKNYRRVLMQQGRVQVDADFNEYTEIEKNIQEAVARAIVGPHGALATGNTAKESGFALFEDGGKWKIASGTFFVDGILLQNDQAVALDAQPFPNGLDLPTAPNGYLVYLEVWERKLSALDAGHEQIKEVALGGADTTVRTQYVWQVKWTKLDKEITEKDCIEDLDTWKALIASQTKPTTLSARSHLPPENEKPCIVKASGGYSGLQNQLYRVEVHHPGKLGGEATFKWSRDNASVQARWLSSPNADELEIDEIGKDAYLSFATDQWVELIDETRILAGIPGSLVKIKKVEGRIITVDPATKTDSIDFKDFENPTIRRWDSAGLAPIKQPNKNQGYLELEKGVEVKFDQPGDSPFSTGDYWLIPARSEIADVEWPLDGTDKPVPQAPRGIVRHYAPVGLLFLGENTPPVFADRRPLFSPLTQQTELSYVSGDGQEGLPKLSSRQPLGAVPEPLIVGVSNGDQPVAGAPVRFKVIKGKSFIHKDEQKSEALIVLTDANGLASVNWKLEPDEDNPFHSVEAKLLSNCQQEKHLPVIFNARLNLASHVIYSDPSCTNLKQEATVDGALKTLSRLTGLYYLGGDGQEFSAGQWLPQPLQVAIRNQCGPVNGATVVYLAPEGSRLAAKPGDFTSANSNKLAVKTDSNGIATCYWNPKRLDELESLQTEASLSDAAGNPIAQPARLHFSTREDSQGSATYPPTVGKGGTYPSLATAFNQLSESTNINLYLLPGIHELGTTTVNTKQSIKLTGAGCVDSIIRVSGELQLTCTECILRDLSVTTGDPKKQNTVLIDAKKAEIQNTLWSRRVSRRSNDAVLQLGRANAKNKASISLRDSKFIALAQITREPFATNKRFLLNSKTPTSVRAKLNILYRLDPERDQDKIRAEAENVATSIRSTSATVRRSWVEAGTEAMTPRITTRNLENSNPLPTVAAMEERTVLIGRLDRIAVAERAVDTSIAPETIRAVTAAPLPVDDANIAASSAFYDTIKSANPSTGKIVGALIAVANARSETMPEMAIAVPSNQTALTLQNNQIAGIVGLSTQFPKELKDDFAKALLRRRFQIGGDLFFSNNEFLQVKTFASHTNPNSQTAIAAFGNVSLENNSFNQGHNSVFGDRVSLQGNRFEANERTGYCLGNTALIIGNQSIPSDNIQLLVLAKQTAESSNIPSFLVGAP